MVTPRRIELFDNSNIQGAYAVAGMVCFVDGVPSKKDYRKKQGHRQPFMKVKITGIQA